jgi:putative ABC transport system ATP-binding protein
MAIFQRLNREAGITLILVTHELDIAAYANRAIYFKDGRLVKDERADQPRLAEEALQQLGAEEG